jgi:3-oxoacyl-[acyl-carrier-protein] synthase II
VRRAVVTGIGAVTPIGHGADGLWAGVLANESAIRAIDRFDASPFPSRIAAQIDDFVPGDHLDARRARRLDRFSALTVAAARMAVEHAALPLPDGRADRTGIWIGSALGGVAFGEEQHANYLLHGARGVAPTLATAVFGGAGASNVAIDLGIHGPAVGNANSCASGAVAVGQALHAIRDGSVDIALAGGAEAPLAPLTLGAFAMIRVLSSRNDDPATASRPFDVARDGFVMSEAACVLVLEEAEAAERRGAKILAEVAGYGASTDAYHLTAPLPSGEAAALAIRSALSDADVEAEAIGYVNAHASSTQLNELAEAKALHLALGEHAARVPVSGTKGLYGHPLGASGALEAAITSMALDHGLLPGTCNLQTLDERCDLNVLREPCIARPAAALSTSFGFGGMNAALVLRSADAMENPGPAHIA